MRNRWMVGALAVLVVAAGLWGLIQNTQKRRLQTRLWNQYTSAFYEVVQQVSAAQVSLAKAMVVVSPEARVNMFGNVSRAAFMAQHEMGRMPISMPTLLRTSKFLTQLGDFSLVQSRKAGAGTPPTDQDRTRTKELYRQASALVNALHQVEARATAGELRWPEIKRGAEQRVTETSRDIVGDGFRRISTQMQEYPTLMYDGPFSDHVQLKQPRGVTGGSVTLSQARGKVRQFFPSEDKTALDIRHVGDGKGKIPTYGFRVTLTRGGAREHFAVDVTKKGGHVVFMSGDRRAGSQAVSVDDAKARASEFLASRGFVNMDPTYAMVVQRQALIPFAFVDNGVRMYPDLIKVKVALDNGQVTGFESLGYLMSHRDRTPPQPKVSLEQARARLNPDLSVTESRLAVIPLETLDEALVHEFRGTLDGERFAVYIDAVTGQERSILKIIDTPRGTLTM